jgi:4-amino-4-deoxy-L-arabinose transferase-like glycosyltransferase
MKRPVALLLILLLALTLFRVWYVGQFDLTPDEAYYWTWSQKLDWCYYDQPAGVAVANALFTGVFGNTTRGVRLGAIILGLIGTWFAYAMARRLGFAEREASVSAGALHLIPLLSSGHVLMLHDTVMAAAAAGLLYFLSRAFFEGGRIFWLASGLFAALALYAKFSAVLLAIGVAGFVLLSPRHRNVLATSGPYLAAVTAGALFAPVIAWNAKHQWIAALAVGKLSNDPNLTLGGRLLNVLDFLGSQAGLVSPILLVMMLIAAVSAIRRIRTEEGERVAFLAMLFVGVFAYFCLQGLRAKVQGNWAALAYLPGTLLLVKHVYARIDEGSKGWAIWSKIGAGLAIATTFVLFLQPLVKIVPMPTGLDLTDQVHGWQELAERVDLELAERPDAVLSARRYQIASELQFYCKGHPEPYVANWSSRGNQYDLWNDWRGLQGRTVLYADYQGRSGKYWRHFAGTQEQPDFIRKRGEQAIQPVHLTFLEGFEFRGDLELYFTDPLAYSVEKIHARRGN